MVNSKIFVITVCVLYFISLLLPGIVYKPTVQDNPKQQTCSMVDHNKNTAQFSCKFSGGEYLCNYVGSGVISVPRDEIVKWCGSDWNTPFSEISYGYEILLNPFAAFHPAWWPNPLLFLALAMATRRRKNASVIVSLIAVSLALTAFTLNSVPRDEGGGNDFMFDHLGIGYYLWLFTLVLVALNAIYMNFKNVSPESAPATPTPDFPTPKTTAEEDIPPVTQ